jgi:hypothetical protein
MAQFLFVSKFHTDFKAAKDDTAKETILRKYARKIISSEAAIDDDRAALCAVASAASIPLPENLRGVVSAPKRTDKARHNRAIKTIIAFWSYQPVKKYHWADFSWKTLECLVKIAQKHDLPTFVAYANQQMLRRHEASVSNYASLRIGEHAAQSAMKGRTHAPLENQDIVAIGSDRSALLNSDLEARMRNWTEPCFCLLRKFGNDENRLLLFTLGQDSLGLLVPASVEIRKCSQCTPRPKTAGLRRTPTDGAPQPAARPDIAAFPARSGRGPRPCMSCPDIERFKLLSQSRGPQASHEKPNPTSEATDDIPSSNSMSYISILQDPTTISKIETIECDILRKHATLFREYYTRLRQESSCGPRYKYRAQWFHRNLNLAKVWAPHECDLGKGSALSADDADVWHFTMDYFIKRFKRGEVFNRPILIKSHTHDDLDIHSVDQYLQYLGAIYRNKDIDITSLTEEGSQKMNISTFQDKFNGYSGLNALNLSNITLGNRPLFTMLPDFKVLDILVESIRTSSGKQISSTPIDIASCREFNILADSGGFSAPHVDALGGYTSVRNLDGCKFWITIPPRAMEHHWEAFHESGSRWLPPGDERLIVIEEGDILVMMPDEFDKPTVHVVHSPLPTLMEGWMSWERSKMLSTLRCLVQIGLNQNSTNEAIAFQLAPVLRELENYMRFDPCWPQIEAVLGELRNLGCQCELGSTHCSCVAAERRCTSLCHSHPQLPQGRTWGCMEDGAQFARCGSKRRRK